MSSSVAMEEEEMEIPEGYAEVVVVRHGETSWNASRVIQVSFFSPIFSLIMPLSSPPQFGDLVAIEVNV